MSIPPLVLYLTSDPSIFGVDDEAKGCVLPSILFITSYFSKLLLPGDSLLTDYSELQEEDDLPL